MGDFYLVHPTADNGKPMKFYEKDYSPEDFEKIWKTVDASGGGSQGEEEGFGDKIKRALGLGASASPKQPSLGAADAATQQEKPMLGPIAPSPEMWKQMDAEKESRDLGALLPKQRAAVDDGSAAAQRIGKRPAAGGRLPVPELAGAGSELSPEPERPKFAALEPEKAAAVEKFVAENGAPKPAGLTDKDKIQKALAYAEEQAGKNRWGANLGRQLTSAADMISGFKGDNTVNDRLYAGADKPVLDEKAKMAAAMAEAERIATRGDKDRDFGLREADLKAKGELSKAQLEEAKADNARADRGLTETERHNKALETATARAAAKKGTGGGHKLQHEAFKDTSDLRKEFSGLPEVKQFKEVSVQYDKVKRAAAKPSAAGDLSMIFAYMKMLDPTSSVKETEFANAQNAAGVPERIAAQWNRMKKGERLSEQQRADFIGQAANLYGAHQTQFSQSAERYKTIGTKNGLAPDDIVGGYELGGGQPAKTASGSKDKALEWAKANPKDPRAAKILQKIGAAP